MFEYDVFISYSLKDKSIVHALAERLKRDGLSVWLDDWVIEPGDSIPLKIQRGLENSHILLMCMSPTYFDSEWGSIEHISILFRNPTNTQRRLIPLLIADCTQPEIIAHLKYIDWRTHSDGEYNKILDSCQKKKPELSSTNLVEQKQRNEKRDEKVELENKQREEDKQRNIKIPKNFTSLSTGMELVLVPAGEFLMGSNDNSWEKPVHKVIINKPFYIGEYPVTQRQWKLIMKDIKHIKHSNLKVLDNPNSGITWYEVKEFIRKLNKIEDTDKYRLPSEAEWEYACRAGTTTRYYFGDDESRLGNYAWYDENADSRTHPVGIKNPNPWGLYDMHGNVLELCQDKWHDNYESAPSDGSAWRDIRTRKESDSSHVMRGGSYNNHSRSCRSSSRGKVPPLGHSHNLGFRVVREI